MHPARNIITWHLEKQEIAVWLKKSSFRISWLLWDFIWAFYLYLISILALRFTFHYYLCVMQWEFMLMLPHLFTLYVCNMSTPLDTHTHTHLSLWWLLVSRNKHLNSFTCLYYLSTTFLIILSTTFYVWKFSFMHYDQMLLVFPTYMLQFTPMSLCSHVIFLLYTFFDKTCIGKAVHHLK